jgi:thiol-disulfide isomerase/thioredoxin
MSLENRIELIVALILFAAIAGGIWKLRTGRAKLVRSGELVDLGKLKAVKNGVPAVSFGKSATLLQFSTETCSVCKSTAKIFSEIEKRHPEVLHLEVDITNRLDLAAHFSIMQTPTTLILDKSGKVISRIGGGPRANVIAEELNKLEIKL